MENEFQTFDSEFGEIKMITIEGKDYFVAKDIANALGYISPHRAYIRYCKNFIKNKDYIISGNSVYLIPENDVILLIQKSTIKPIEYKIKFNAWLMHEFGFKDKFIIEEKEK